ncbi:MAG: hypothetical protein F4Z42_01445 [Holophagales bacterium]|nr:hypothetical protein [Holophagales bacterium]
MLDAALQALGEPAQLDAVLLFLLETLGRIRGEVLAVEDLEFGHLRLVAAAGVFDLPPLTFAEGLLLGRRDAPALELL